MTTVIDLARDCGVTSGRARKVAAKLGVVVNEKQGRTFGYRELSDWDAQRLRERLAPRQRVDDASSDVESVSVDPGAGDDRCRLPDAPGLPLQYLDMMSDPAVRESFSLMRWQREERLMSLLRWARVQELI